MPVLEPYAVGPQKQTDSLSPFLRLCRILNVVLPCFCAAVEGWGFT